MHALQHCWHLRLISYLSLTHFLVSPRKGWGTFAGLLESGAWLQQTVLRDADGDAGRAVPVLGPQEPPPWTPTLSPLLSPFSSRGLRCSSPTSVFPFAVGSSLLSIFLAMLSVFILPSPFLPFSPGEHGAAPWQLP